MNLAAVPDLTPIPVTGVWCRAIRSRYLSRPLAFGHTMAHAGRFNGGTAEHPGPAAIYLAEDVILAQLEVGVIVAATNEGQPLIPNPITESWTFSPIDIRLSVVADLTDPLELAKIDTSFQELTGDWREYARRPAVPPLRAPDFSNVPTQRLGHALHRHKYEGFITFSARLPRKKSLIIFPTRLRKSSSVTYTDQATGTVHTPTP